jgi:hypothetical protein
MNTNSADEKYVRVQDTDGNLYVCPMEGFSSQERIREDDLDDCVENDVVGRYAGQLAIVES